MAYLTPTDLSEALASLRQPGASVIAGGTDWFPARGARLTDGPLLDVTALPGFREVTKDAAGWRIGAATTWTDIMRADLPPAFETLKMAAREVGSVQIQNAGTVAGNLCNASPAADGVPPLLVLEAQVEMVSATGTRTLPLADFLLGPRRTALGADELVSAVIVPDHATSGQSTFLKVGARKYLVISIAMLAVRLEYDDGFISRAAVAAGSCGPTAVRLRTAEALLQGCEKGAFPVLNAASFPEISPIDDHRASAGYRRAAVTEMLTRALQTLKDTA